MAGEAVDTEQDKAGGHDNIVLFETRSRKRIIPSSKEMETDCRVARNSELIFGKSTICIGKSVRCEQEIS